MQKENLSGAFTGFKNHLYVLSIYCVLSHSKGAFFYYSNIFRSQNKYARRFVCFP